MLHLGGGGRVYAGALAGLVRVDAALDAPADSSAEAGHRSEGVADDRRDDAGNRGVVIQADADRHDDVGDRHERHDDLREVRDALDAAENDEAERDDDADRRNQFGLADLTERRRHDARAADGEIDR